MKPGPTEWDDPIIGIHGNESLNITQKYVFITVCLLYIYTYQKNDYKRLRLME